MAIEEYGGNPAWVFAQVTTKTKLFVEMFLIKYCLLASFTWSCTDNTLKNMF